MDAKRYEGMQRIVISYLSGICLFCLIWMVIQAGVSAQTASSTENEETGMTEMGAHNVFDRLLKRHVSSDGEVDYAAIKQGDDLDIYLAHLSTVDPAELSEAEALALWVNAYNAYTIKLIVDNYPVGSIREITPLRIKGIWLAVPKINSPFEYKLANVGGTVYSLDEIEHSILRKEFNEPRIHFALVCASYSCPPLRREPYEAGRLDAQLDDQARTFLHDPRKNRIEANGRNIQLSKIFRWFKEDFTKEGKSLQQFLAAYFEGDIQEKLEANAFGLKYMKYDWRLNDVGSFNN